MNHIAENIRIRKAAEAIIELATEDNGTNVAFWTIIRDHAIRFAPIAERVEPVTPMSDDESRKFGRTVVNFGMHRDKAYDDVPLEYLEWLADRNIEILRYIRSRRIKAERET